MKFNFWDKEIELADDCKNYFEIYHKYMSEAEQLKKTLIDIKGNITKENWREKLENVNFVVEYCINERIKLIIQEMSQNDIYDRSIRDYHNRGYYGWQNEVEKFYSFMKKIDKELADKIIREAQEAYQRERAKITGNSYGILTNSYSSALAYSISDSLTLHSQKEEAKVNYEISRQAIVNNAKNTFEHECQNYLKFTLIKNTLNHIDTFYSSLFDRYISELIKLGKIKPIFFYESKANKLLSDFETKLNKKDLICLAIKENPISIFENKEIIYYIFREGAGEELLKLIEFTCYRENVSNMIEEDIFANIKIEKFRKLIEENEHKIEYLSKIKYEDKEEIIKKYCQIVFERISQSEVKDIHRLQRSDDTIDFVCEKLNKDKFEFLDKPIRSIIEKTYEKLNINNQNSSNITKDEIIKLILFNFFFIVFLGVPFIVAILWFVIIGYSINLLYEDSKQYKEFEKEEKKIYNDKFFIDKYIKEKIKDDRKNDIIEMEQELEEKYLDAKQQKNNKNSRNKTTVGFILSMQIVFILYCMSLTDKY